MVVCFYENDMMDITGHELDAIYAELDKNDFGSIFFEAFLKSVVQVDELIENSVLQTAFMAMDFNRNGQLTLD